MKQILNLYLENMIVQGSINLFFMFFLMIALSKFIMGPVKVQGVSQHPVFGKYTKHIPNLMSYLRFPLGIWMVVLFFLDNDCCSFLFFSFHISFMLICLFDFLDGQFARKWNAITEDGKSLDPAADKWVTFCLAAAAYLFSTFYWWALIIIFAREMISIWQRKRLSKKGIDVSAKWLGKIKTGVQFTVLYIILLRSQELQGSILLEKLARLFPAGMMLWAVILLCFCTIISLFPFFQSFSYVNNYTMSQKEESNQSWYLIWLPNLLTIGNYLCGITAVFFSVSQVEVQYRSFVVLFWILAAAVCDALDGPLARKLKSYSEFGACLDSSTDLSTFGLATALIIFFRFTAIKGDGSSFLGIMVAIVYFSLVHMRLARFTKRSDEKEDKGEKGDFLGLPSPAASAAVLVIFTFSNNLIFLFLSILFLSLLMYSKIDFISHSNSLKKPLYKYVMIPMLLTAFMMLIFLIFQQPFVSRNFSRELKVYFNICSWILFLPLIFYIADAVKRTFIDRKKEGFLLD